ncbi:MAG: hypothetical protein HXS47_10745 [Theionarchaea archaeon]|nr:hypothetical protein [Theionarchaea archaeon]
MHGITTQMEVKAYASIKTAAYSIASLEFLEIDEIIFFETWNRKQYTHPDKKEKENGKGKKNNFQKLVFLHSFNMDLRASRVLGRRSLSEGRVAQKDLVIAFASGSPGSVAQKAFDTSNTSFSEGRVAQNALVKLSSIFSLSGFNGLIPVLPPPSYIIM